MLDKAPSTDFRLSIRTTRTPYDPHRQVLDELRYLEDYFMGLQKQGKPVVELYEKVQTLYTVAKNVAYASSFHRPFIPSFQQVQSCGNVLPRLYLLVTAAGVYIKSQEAPAKDILKDLVEMCKGVQHPTRGLFLRNYLSQVEDVYIRALRKANLYARWHSFSCMHHHPNTRR